MEIGIIKGILCVPALVAMAITDARPYKILPGYWLYLLAVGVGIRLWKDSLWPEGVAAGMSLFLPLALAFYITRGGMLGGGDVKLMGAAGILLGTVQGLVALLIAAVFALMVNLPKQMGKKRHGEAFAFGPYLAVGIGVCLVVGEQVEKIL